MTSEELLLLSNKAHTSVKELVSPGSGVSYILLFHANTQREESDKKEGSTNLHTNFNSNDIEESLLLATLECMWARKGRAKFFAINTESK